MSIKRFFFRLAVLALVPLSCLAQTTIVTGSQISQSGTLLPKGTICLQPTGVAGSGFQVGIPGQSTSGKVCRDVVTGVIMTTLGGVAVGPLTVADTSLTTPLNICYRATITDSSGLGLTYPCVQPFGSTWSFDSFVPSLPNQPLGQAIANLHIQYAVIDNCTGAGCGSGSGGTPWTSAPLMDGTAAPGTSSLYARGDHVHPTDTTREAHSALATVAESGSYNDLSSKPSIPAAQIQSDWNEANTALLDFIKNKPVIPAGQVNSDWNASSGLAQILNKPTIPAGPPYSESQITNLPTDLAAKEAHSALAAVAESGSYNDLSSKPVIPAAQIQSDWNEANTALLDFIKNKPTPYTLPAASAGALGGLYSKDCSLLGASYVMQKINTDGTETCVLVATGGATWGAIGGTLSNQSDLNTALGAKENHSALATVAESGSYPDLINKPTIPAGPPYTESQITNLPTDLAAKEAHSALAAVAESGSYNDLSSKPVIPSAQIQSDWNEANTALLDFIKNKPVIPAGQVNSDWNASSGLAQILNKPSIPAGPPYTESQITNLPTDLAAKEAHSALAAVAESGSYNDLSSKPSIPAGQVQSDWNEANTALLDFIKNKPVIPAGQVNSDWNASSGLAQILNKPSIPAGPPYTESQITNLPTDLAAKEAHSALAAVAETGSYTDLSNQPSIPAGPPYAESQITNLPTDLAAKEAHSALAAVAESGSYLDLINKPTIPAAQIQSDWNEANSGLLDFIKNKPALGSLAALSTLTSAYVDSSVCSNAGCSQTAANASAVPASGVGSGALPAGVTLPWSQVTGRGGSCQTGVGDGLNAIPAGTYLQSFCYNDSGVTRTITSVRCNVDSSTGTPTLAASGATLGSIAAAFNCSTSFAAAGSLVGTALTAGDSINFTFVAAGTAKQTTWVVSYTQ